MATTTHGLAILTNSCVKPPIDPKTGLSSSFHDRLQDSLQHYNEPDAEKYVENEDNGGQEYSSNHVFPAPANDTISRELSNVSDEEFYEKLLQLKNEHKKTLALCEKLYKRKISKGYQGGRPANGFLGTVPTATEQRDLITNGHEYNNTVGYDDIEVRTSVRESYSKPPTGRPPISPGARTTNVGLRSLATVPRPRPSSAPVFKPGALTRSLDEEVWQKIINERRKAAEERAEEEVEDEAREEITNRERWEMTQSETYDNPELSAALSRIEDMWENFSLENYAPRQERPSSASVTKREKEMKIQEWRHRITIPKPFKMTVREENKEKKESKILKECQEAYIQKQQEEEMECEKKFKASPAPAHIYLPLYDEIMEKKEARRRYVQQYSKDLLKSQEAPFSFLKREESKNQHKRRNSAPQIEIRKSFTAKPAPTFLYDNSVQDKIKEEEEYRKIRIKMRSKELLKTANLPPSMEARKQIEEERRKQKYFRNKRKSSNKLKVNHEVPDYDELYRHFQKELARRKREREATVMQPFQLHSTEVTRSSKEKILRDMQKDDENLTENRWPYKNSRLPPKRSLGAMSSSLDSIPAKMTVSADLRSNVTKKKLNSLTQKEIEDLKLERKRRIREMRLRRDIQERTSDRDTSRSLDKTYEQKVKGMRESDRSRQEEYKNQLKEMKERVEKRPLLFEQETQTNAKVAAQKKFSAMLRTHGINEDFVQSRSSRTASVHADDDDDYQDDYHDDFETSHPRDDSALSASEGEEIEET